MKITLRLIISLIFISIIVAGSFTYIQVQNEKNRLKKELETRTSLISESLQESIKDIILTSTQKKLNLFIHRFSSTEKLLGIVVYDSLARFLVTNNDFFRFLPDSSIVVWESLVNKETLSEYQEIEGKRIYLLTKSIVFEGRPLAALVVICDASYIETRINSIWYNSFIRLLIQILLIALTTVIIVRWSITGPIAQISIWIRNFRTGKSSPQWTLPRGDILKPLAEEVTLLARKMSKDVITGDKGLPSQLTDLKWTPEHLKEVVRHEIGDKRLVVISNREPVMSIKNGNVIENIVPAGGLVSALDPVLTSCGGVWIAHGSGDADIETADSRGRFLIPPDMPAYTLRRVFLTKEEEQGYYYGFSNEGLWPLCHMTHTRPIFRIEDWIYYQNVNLKFANILLDEIKSDKEPLILIQDYHFALLPMLIREKRPDARIAIFWHIPWPNPEIFGICPWKQEILIGLLGCDLIGFHIQFHCNNFLETCDRYLESRINWEQFAVERHKRLSIVKPFPISIAIPNAKDKSQTIAQEREHCKKEVQAELNIKCKYLGVGVDRIDYTKGIIERLQGIERFFEKHTEYIGQFTFVELGAPSRTHLKPYRDLVLDLDVTVDKINWRLQTDTWKPIVLLKANHSHQTISKYYRAADVCLVTSLHDGMNLVAKEFVAAQQDEDGVLILSQFTGAARELQDSLIINPYNIEEIADAIYTALTMDRKERVERMKNMRAIVLDRNVYKWAGNLISTLTSIRHL
jgi:trehalose 6-phosphate synthase